MTQVHEGGCQCRAVRFRLAGAPLTVYACHCTDCQRRSGSAFGITLLAAQAQLEIVRGTPARYDYTEDDGRRWIGAFCAQCVVRLWSESPQLREVRFVAAGTLDDARAFAPAAHVWIRSRQPWMPIPHGVPTFAQQPDMEVLVRAWRERRR